MGVEGLVKLVSSWRMIAMPAMPKVMMDPELDTEGGQFQRLLHSPTNAFRSTHIVVTLEFRNDSFDVSWP